MSVSRNWGIGLYLITWAASVAYLYAAGAEWMLAAFLLGIFGLILSPIAVWLTRNTAAPELTVRMPARESLALLTYLAIYGLLFFGPLYGWFKGAIPDGPVEELSVLAFKLVVHVGLPSIVIYALRGSIADLWRGHFDRKGVLAATILFSLLLVGLNAVISPSLKNLDAAGLSPMGKVGWFFLSWVWMSIVAGLCEEYLFRALLQTRLTAWSGSATFAIAVTAIMFGLAHAPGLYLRGDAETFGHSKDALQVIAYSIAVLSPTGIFFGTLWHRTKSLAAGSIIHGAVDALPFASSLAALFVATG